MPTIHENTSILFVNLYGQLCTQYSHIYVIIYTGQYQYTGIKNMKNLIILAFIYIYRVKILLLKETIAQV